ncbi:ribosome-associated translation inhibitor RaiA [Candidatus Saccharibacteria bacterium]|nr:MAG: ribosome-associated translation inhibitor RaiA [Candidatus Saccharibacteria bacterium]
MIQKLEVQGIHTEISADLQKYVEKKIGQLDKYMPRYARESAHVEVKLKEKKIKNRVECSCEVILHLPKETFTIKETTVNLFAAVDVVEQKLKNHIKKYKQTHGTGRLHQRVLARFKRSSARSSG